jgi:pSer/pThr/pTyr-binding forkhead associated (FHA) protein
MSQGKGPLDPSAFDDFGETMIASDVELAKPSGPKGPVISTGASQGVPTFTPSPEMPSPTLPMAQQSPIGSPFQQSAAAAHSPEDDDATRLLDSEESDERPDVSGDSTVMHDNLAMANLTVLEGLQKGKDFLLLGDKITFGREKDNTISYPDLAVSRHHFEIHHNDGKYLLKDLGSGNGTLVNNKKVKGTQNLKTGDRILVGKSVFQFHIRGEDITPIGGDSKGGSSTTIFAILGFLLIAGIGVGGFFFYKESEKKRERQAVEKDLDKADEFMQQRKYSKALVLFGKHRDSKLFPGRIATGLKNAARGRSEQELAEDLKTARGHVKNQAWNDALFLLNKHRARNDLRVKHYVNLVQTEQKTKSLLSRAQIEIKQQRLEDARKTLQKVEATMLPGSSSYNELFWKLQGQAKVQVIPAVVAPVAPPKPVVKRTPYCKRRSFRRCKNTRNRSWRCRRWRKRCVRRVRVVRRAAPKKCNTALCKAIKTFNQGQSEDAAKLFAAAGKSEMQQKVLSFRKAYNSATIAANDREPNQALRHLTKALNLDNEIGNGRGVYSRSLRRMLSEMYNLKGIRAKTAQNYSAAYQNFARANRYRKNRVSKQQLADLTRRAKALFETGKSKIKSNPRTARKLLTRARDMIRPGTALYNQISQTLVNIP